MLTQLTIQNFALVDHLDLELEPGMTAITGETGAGKSIMLDALGLTLGDRADLDVIRNGEDRADISACFSLHKQLQACEWLKAHDIPLDENICILRRVLTRDGRSRAYINGQATTLNDLRELGELLIDIHSQHEHQSLLKTATHQRLLDEFGGLHQQAREVSDLASELRLASNQLDRLRNRTAADAAQLELLTYQVRELEELNMQPGEYQALESEHQQLSHADAARNALQGVLDICSENDEFNVEQALRRACSLMEDLPFRTPQLDEAAEMLGSALIQIEEAGGSLGKAMDRIELNPSRLEEVDQRLALAHRLARKHKVEPETLHALAADLASQVKAMGGTDEQMEVMQKQCNALQSSYRTMALQLSKKRQQAAGKLEKAVNEKLKLLGMGSARFSLALNTDESGDPGPRGMDHAEFLVSTNPGQAPKALVKIASGGELSRISLAIQVVTAQTSSIPVLVFDEVDVGIGGGTAKTVGELLHTLGNNGQVLCVTHQAQVAAQADQHLLVSKASANNNTATALRQLTDKERVTEIARMLGGDELSDKSLAHARELLA